MNDVMTQHAKVGSAHTRLLSIAESYTQEGMTMEISGGKIDGIDMAFESANSVKSQMLLKSSVYAMQAANLSYSRMIGLIG
jgi:flagellin-like hook-associated protein FlgL